MLKTKTRRKALNLLHNLGPRVAAGYLRNQGWSLEGTLAFLLRRDHGAAIA